MPAKSKAPRITFDDIADLTDREIQQILRNVETKDLALALLGATSRLSRRIFSNISERVGSMIKDEMAFREGAKPSDIDKVRTRILKVADRLRGEGQITTPPPAKTPARRKPKPSKRYLAVKRSARTLSKRPLMQLHLDEINRMLVGFAEIAKREGVLALEDMVKNVQDAFLDKGIRLTVDGTEPSHIETVLETWMDSLLREYEVRYKKVIEGLGSIQRGYNPRLIEQRLQVLY